MSDIASHIRSIESAAPESVAPLSASPMGRRVADADIVAPPRPEDKSGEGFAKDFDWGPVPWLWVAAWLIGWALLVAIAAWWIGEGSVPGRAVWMWVVIWAVGGLAVAALLTRAAAQAIERASTRSRLSRAHTEIMQLEKRLQASTASMFQATRTLSEATDMLLEQVDTSRDDLRNQIASAQTLTDALKSQTEGLVDAQSVATAQASERLGLALPASATQPSLNLRPAPDDAPVFATADIPVSPAPVVASVRPTPTRDGWTWSDMLKTVDDDAGDVISGSVISGDEGASFEDEDYDERSFDDGAASVIALMSKEGLSPDVLVDEGNILDALRIWSSQGRAAMGQLLSIRFDEPARVMRARIDADPSELSMVQAFSELRGETMDAMRASERQADCMSEAGKAWLFTQAVLSL